MKTYSKEERYRSIEDMPKEYFTQQKNMVASDKHFYPRYHIAPHYGLLNDPNGLIEVNETHHIFYQYHPVAPTHGLKYWYHLSTKDFVHYEDLGIILKPDSKYNKYGVWSGGALLENDNIALFFSANTFDKNDVHYPSQAIALINSDNQIIKQEQIIFSDEEYTRHFRDPKPWKVDDKYYLVLGAQKKEPKEGVLVLYEGDSLFSWRKVGNIKTIFKTNAFMYECPDYFELDDNGIIAFSPQGITNTKEAEFQNVHSVVYSIGSKLDLNNAQFDGKKIYEFDKGFDFYAPQTYLDSKGRRILIGWLGVSDLYYPYDEEYRWSQMLTIPRELSIDDNVIVQKPIDELMVLRKDKQEISNGFNKLNSNSFELELKVDKNFSIHIKNEACEEISFVGDDKFYILDRSKQGIDVNKQYGTTRKSIRSLEDAQIVRMFYDCSSLEIFLDDGKTVFTSRVFLKNISSLVCEGIRHGDLYLMHNIKYHV